MHWVLSGLIAGVSLSLLIVVLGLLGATLITPGMITAIALAIGATSLITVIGVWMLTAPDPGSLLTQRRLSARSLARWCTIAQTIAAPLQYTAFSTGALPMTGIAGGVSLPASLLFAIAECVAGVALAGKLAVLVYLNSLALRIPRAGLAQQTRVVMWGYGTSQAGMLLLGAMLLLVLPRAMSGTGGGLLVTGCFVCTAWLGSLVFGIWGLVVLTLYATAFREAAEAAQAISNEAEFSAQRQMRAGEDGHG